MAFQTMETEGMQQYHGVYLLVYQLLTPSILVSFRSTEDYHDTPPLS
jgi:hypothetical protein